MSEPKKMTKSAKRWAATKARFAEDPEFEIEWRRKRNINRRACRAKMKEEDPERYKALLEQLNRYKSAWRINKGNVPRKRYRCVLNMCAVMVRMFERGLAPTFADNALAKSAVTKQQVPVAIVEKPDVKVVVPKKAKASDREKNIRWSQILRTVSLVRAVVTDEEILNNKIDKLIEEYIEKYGSLTCWQEHSISTERIINRERNYQCIG